MPRLDAACHPRSSQRSEIAGAKGVGGRGVFDVLDHQATTSVSCVARNGTMASSDPAITRNDAVGDAHAPLPCSTRASAVRRVLRDTHAVPAT